MKKLILILCISFIFLNLKGQTNYRDVVYLKNGSIIKGQVLEQIPSKTLKIETSDGSIFVYKMEEVTKISKEKIQLVDNKNLNNPIGNNRLSKSAAENAIRIFVRRNSFNGDGAWGQKGNFNESSIKTIQPISQFSVNEAAITVSFDYVDNFTHDNLVLKFNYKKNIDNIWFLTSVTGISGVGATATHVWINKCNNLNIQVEDVPEGIDKPVDYNSAKGNPKEPTIDVALPKSIKLFRISKSVNSYDFNAEKIVSNNVDFQISTPVNQFEFGDKIQNKIFDMVNASDRFELLNTDTLNTSKISYNFSFDYNYTTTSDVTNNVRFYSTYFYLNINLRKDKVSIKKISLRKATGFMAGDANKEQSVLSVVDKFDVGFNEFVIENFPITGTINQVVEQNKSGQIKKINIKIDGDYKALKGLKFIVNNDGFSHEKPSIEITDYDNISKSYVCKVLNSAELIATELSNKKVLRISSIIL